MKYQIKLVFKKILDSKDLIKKFVSLNSNQIYDFFKEIYTSDEISEHLNFITKEEFWQEILSMITGEKIESLDDLEKVAGGKISIKNRVLPGVLSLLMVGGNLVPGINRTLFDSRASAGTTIKLTVTIPEPWESPRIKHLINTDKTLRDMFKSPDTSNGKDITTHVNKQRWVAKVVEPFRSKKTVKSPLGSDWYSLMDYSLPLILNKWRSDDNVKINVGGLLKYVLSDGYAGGLLNKVYQSLPPGTGGIFLRMVPNAAQFTKDNEPLRSGVQDMAIHKLLLSYVVEIATLFQVCDLETLIQNPTVKTALDNNFGRFMTLRIAGSTIKGACYSENHTLVASEYVKQTILPYLKQIDEDLLNAKDSVINALKDVIPEMRDVLDVVTNAGNLLNPANPKGVAGVVEKVSDLARDLTGWHYTKETMDQITTHLKNIADATTSKEDVLKALQELKEIHEKRLTATDSERKKGITCEGTPKQIKLDEMMSKLCELIGNLNKQESTAEELSNAKELSGEILTFINDNNSVKEQLDNILQDTRSLLNKLNGDDGSLQKVLRNLEKGLEILEDNNFFGKVAALPDELKNLKDDVFKEWKSLKSETGLLGRANNIAEDLEKVTSFISNPLVASGILGAGGAALLEGTTGVFSKLLKSSLNCAKSAFASIKKSYNENIYNKLVLENDPIKLKKMVSEYLKSTLMFPGQVSDNLAEILSSGTMSSEKPKMLELSGNVSSGVFSEIHKSVFKNDLETWQTVNQSMVKPRVISRTLVNGAKERIELSLADTIFNTTNPVIKKLLNNTSTTLVFENLTDSSIIDRLEEVRHNNGVLRLYDNNSGDYVEYDVSNTLFLISNRNNTDQRDQLKFAEQVHFGDFTEEEYAYIVAEKLGDMSASYYDKYKITVDFSDDFVENIARKAVKDHAGYDDAEKYLQPVTPAMIQFLDTEKSEGRPIKKLKLECYEENEKIMFRHQEVLEKQKDVDQIEEISDGHSGDFLETREF